MLQILSFSNLDMPRYLAVEKWYTNRPTFFWAAVAEVGGNSLAISLLNLVLRHKIPPVTWGAERGGSQITKRCTLKIHNQAVTLKCKSWRKAQGQNPILLYESAWNSVKNPHPKRRKDTHRKGRKCKVHWENKRYLKVDMEKLQVNTQMYEAPIQQNT